MTDNRSDMPKDMAAYGEEMYQRGCYDTLAKMGATLGRLMGEIPQTWREPELPLRSQRENGQPFDWPIELLGINNHAINILRRGKIHTIKELVKLSKADLLGFRGMGTGTVIDIERGLERHELSLRESLIPAS